MKPSEEKTTQEPKKTETAHPNAIFPPSIEEADKVDAYRDSILGARERLEKDFQKWLKASHPVDARVLKKIVKRQVKIAREMESAVAELSFYKKFLTEGDCPCPNCSPDGELASMFKNGGSFSLDDLQNAEGNDIREKLASMMTVKVTNDLFEGIIGMSRRGEKGEA